MKVHDELIRQARRHIGHKEVTRNDSPLIAQWRGYCRKTAPCPWCALFVTGMLINTADALGMHYKGPRTAGVHAFVKAARKMGAIRDNIEPGYIVAHDSGQGLGHIGIAVNSSHSETWIDGAMDIHEDQITSIEGNTNAAGSREGDRVAEKEREHSYWSLAIIDPSVLFV